MGRAELWPAWHTSRPSTAESPDLHQRRVSCDVGMACLSGEVPTGWLLQLRTRACLADLDACPWEGILFRASCNAGSSMPIQSAPQQGLLLYRTEACLTELDAANEARLLHRVWQRLRAGRVDDACQLCAQCSQHWRAASLGGAGLWGPMPLGELKQLSFSLVLQRLQDTLHGAPSAQHAGLQQQPGIEGSLPSAEWKFCTGTGPHGCVH